MEPNIFGAWFNYYPNLNTCIGEIHHQFQSHKFSRATIHSLQPSLKLTRYLPLPGPVAQSVASPTADPGVSSFIPARSHSFMEIDHEIISTVILLLLIQEELLSVTGQSLCTKYRSACPGKSVVMDLW